MSAIIATHCMLRIIQKIDYKCETTLNPSNASVFETNLFFLPFDCSAGLHTVSIKLEMNGPRRDSNMRSPSNDSQKLLKRAFLFAHMNRVRREALNVDLFMRTPNEPRPMMGLYVWMDGRDECHPRAENLTPALRNNTLKPTKAIASKCNLLQRQRADQRSGGHGSGFLSRQTSQLDVSARSGLKFPM